MKNVKNIADDYNNYIDVIKYEKEIAPYPRPDQHIRKTPKIHNNQPCVCGSGKKFKKCCKNK